MKQRQVQHFGYEFRYDTNNVDLNKPLAQKIPEQCSIFWKRLAEHENINFEPDQLTVNLYRPGQGKLTFHGKILDSHQKY